MSDNQKTLYKRVFSNVTWSIVGESIGKGTMFLAGIYLARVLGVANFGLFSLAQTIIFYLWIIVDLGTSMYAIREIAKNKHESEKIIGVLFTIRMIFGIVIFTLYATILQLIHIEEVSRSTFTACAVYLISYSLYTDWIFKGYEKFRLIFWGTSISSFTYLAGIIIFVHDTDDIIKAALLWSISYLAGSTSLLFYLQKIMRIRIRLVFDADKWFKHIRQSVSFALSGALMMMYMYLPILFLKYFSDNYSVGIFSAAFRLITLLSAVGLLLPMSIYPILSDMYVNNKKAFLKGQSLFLSFMLTAGIIIAVSFFMYSGIIISKLYGSGYARSVDVLDVLIWLVPLVFIKYSFGISLFAANAQKYHNITYGIGVIIALLCGFGLIPTKGILGSAITLLVSETVIVISMASFYYFPIRNKLQTV